MGIQEAIKANNKYRARRFYEKALSTAKDNLDKKPSDTVNERLKQAHLIYLNFLDDFLDRKEKLKVYKNLHKLLPKDGYLEEYKKLMGKSYKKRLIVGDGNFSYTEDLINQHKDTHPDLAKSITPTEITDWYLSDADTKKRVQKLMEEGVKFLFDVDATTIHEKFKSKRFHRIHWNCPFGSSGPIPEKIEKFYKSASDLQKPFDRVHMTLAQE
nr:hypothetical protein [Candidatus Anoxychlamydiales bacterium]